jgi:hypothetical protein
MPLAGRRLGAPPWPAADGDASLMEAERSPCPARVESPMVTGLLGCEVTRVPDQAAVWEAIGASMPTSHA